MSGKTKAGYGKVLDLRDKKLNAMCDPKIRH